MLVTALCATGPSEKIDPEGAERALSGAEWLAEQTDGSDISDAARQQPGLAVRLLQEGGATRKNAAAFVAHLESIGYGDPQIARAAWLQEMQAVVQAARAAAIDPRPPRVIESELETLPTVPLDAKGAAERQRLLDELALATYDAEERAAAAAVQARLDRLRARVFPGSGEN